MYGAKTSSCSDINSRTTYPTCLLLLAHFGDMWPVNAAWTGDRHGSPAQSTLLLYTYKAIPTIKAGTNVHAPENRPHDLRVRMDDISRYSNDWSGVAIAHGSKSEFEEGVPTPIQHSLLGCA